MTESEIGGFEDYLLSLLSRWSGVLRLPPSDFYESTIQEISLILNAYQSSQEESYYLNLIAGYNATGYYKAKNFKPIEPFSKVTAEAKRDKRQEAEDSLAFLRKATEDV